MWTDGTFDTTFIILRLIGHYTHTVTLIVERFWVAVESHLTCSIYLLCQSSKYLSIIIYL